MKLALDEAENKVRLPNTSLAEQHKLELEDFIRRRGHQEVRQRGRPANFAFFFLAVVQNFAAPNGNDNFLLFWANTLGRYPQDTPRYYNNTNLLLILAGTRACHDKESLVRVLLTNRHMLREFSFCSSGGRSDCGAPWKHTGRVNRRIESVPTEVQ